MMDEGSLAQVSVGRLGVITEIEFEIVPQRMVQRDTYTTSFDDFVDAIQALQDEHNEAQENGPEAVASVLAAYEGTQVQCPAWEASPQNFGSEFWNLSSATKVCVLVFYLKSEW